METLATSKPTAQGKIRPLSRRKTMGKYYKSRKQLCEHLAVHFSSLSGDWQDEYKTWAETTGYQQQQQEAAGIVAYEEQVEVKSMVRCVLLE